MSATPRFWQSTSFDHAHISSNSLGQHHFSVPHAASTLVNVDNVAFKQTMSIAGRKLSSPSINAGASAGVRFPQQQQQAAVLREQSQSQRASPSLASSASIMASPAGTQQQQLYMTSSPVISAPSTPLLLAKELPLAPPSVPHTPPPHTLSTSTFNNNVNSVNSNASLASSSVHPDMYHHTRPAQQFRYRNAHSRSSSFSSTNNVTFPSVSISSIATTTTPNSAMSPSSPIVQPTTPLLSTQAPSPVTPHSNNHSRRTSLITSVLTNNATTPTSSNGGGSPASAPMSPTSSYGLPSPTFPPRPLPPPTNHHAIHAHSITSAPIRPPRSPARPAGLISPLTTLTSLPAPSNASASPASVSQPIPRVKPPTMLGIAQASGSMSRRNSRQVSVRLSTAFFQPPSVPGSRSVSRSRAVSTTTEDIYINEDRIGFGGHLISSRRGSAVSAYNNGAGQVEVLRPGDIIGQGCLLHGEFVRAVRGTGSNTSVGTSAKVRYEVVRSLGTGSYAVVYLVREILPPPPPPNRDGDMFDEDLFGIVPPQPPFGVYSLTTRSLSNRSATRRASLLKPIEERPSPSLSSPPAFTYGKEFAIKVLSKSNLDPDELAVQMTEVTIHQSLKVHPNIVTLHSTLETDALLLLVLEYVPGEDLYYFLEQQQKECVEANDDERGSMYSVSSSGRAGSSSYDYDSDADNLCGDGDGDEPVRGRKPHRRNHHRMKMTNAENVSDEPHVAMQGSGTPPTPSLLSSVHPAHMLSRERLRLIASMFSQMCDAVQACHTQGIAHRDIKPENFIVTSSSTCSNSNKDERKVIVKLSDFGLATTEKFSVDVDCGSAPYMSYECRNSVGPTYATRPADVWSLGIVLINMLYHHNLWQDTFEGDEFFGAFRQHPVTFLMERSPGMTRDVAEFLANRVFRILPDCPSTDADTDPEAWAKYEHDVARERVSARELGEWVRNLPALFYSNTSGAAGSGNMETPVAIVTAATPDSRRSSLRDVIAADFTHSPDCVYNQLQEAATDAVDVEDEDEDEVEADKTFTQMDATQGFFENDDDVEDYGIVLRTGAFAVSGLTPNTQSFPPTSNSIHRSPRFHPPSSPLPSEPMPLAQPVKFVDSNASDLVTSNGECVACSHDEHLGLGLSCAMNPGEGEGEVFKAGPFSVRSRRRGQRRKKDASISGPGAGASSIPPSAFSSPNPASILSLPPTHLDDLAQDTQNLARELSRAKPPTISQPRSTSCGRSRAPTVSHTTAPPIPSLPTSPSAVGKIAPSPLDFPVIDPSTPSLPPSVAAVVAPTKKSSKWNLLGSWRDRDNDSMAVSERAASILKGLDSTYHPSSSSSTSGGSKSQTSSSSSNYSSFDSSGSAHRFSVASSASTAATTVSSSSSIAFVPPPLAQHLTSPTSAGPDGTPWRERLQHQRSGWDSTSPPSRNGLHERWDRSPVSGTHSGRSNATTLASWRKDQNGSVPASAASSVYNNLSGGSSSASSTFTRLGNGSEMSFSTTATTISASSGFNVGGTAGVLGQQLRDKKSQSTLNRPPHKANSPPQAKQQRSGLPPNIKPMPGIPWELDELPRQMHPLVNGKMPMGNIHGGPPQRRGQRNGAAPPKSTPLDTITERPKGARRPTSPDAESAESEGSASPVEQQQHQQRKKIVKAQSNTLAKLLFKTKRD